MEPVIQSPSISPARPGTQVRLTPVTRAWPLRTVIGLFAILERMLTSVKFGILLLVLLALGAIAGTFIESWVGTPNGTPTAQRLVYHSWWYISLMALLAITLNAASWPFYERTWRWPKFKTLRRHARIFDMLPVHRELAGDFPVEKVKAALERHVGPVLADGPALFAQKGILQRWGFVVTHLGMTLLLAGGVFLSVMAHYQGPPGTMSIEIGEGMTRNWLWMPDPDDRTRQIQRGLPFAVRLHDFDAESFPGTDLPRYFGSEVEIIDAEGHSTFHTITMNEAVRWNGWKLSQSGYVFLDQPMGPFQEDQYRQMDGAAFTELQHDGRIAIRLIDRASGREYPTFDVGVGTRVPVPNSDFMFETADGQTFGVYRNERQIAEGRINPGAAPKPGEAASAEVSMGNSVVPFEAIVAGRMSGAYSVLGVMRESNGIKMFFYLSFVLFGLGPYIAFTTCFRQVWALVDSSGKRVILGGRAWGRKAALPATLDRILADLKETHR